MGKIKKSWVFLEKMLGVFVIFYLVEDINKKSAVKSMGKCFGGKGTEWVLLPL